MNSVKRMNKISSKTRRSFVMWFDSTVHAKSEFDCSSPYWSKLSLLRLFQILWRHYQSIQPIRYGSIGLHIDRSGLYHFPNGFGNVALSSYKTFGKKNFTWISWIDLFALKLKHFFRKWIHFKRIFCCNVWLWLLEHQRYWHFAILECWPLIATTKWQMLSMNQIGNDYRLNCKSI